MNNNSKDENEIINETKNEIKKPRSVKWIIIKYSITIAIIVAVVLTLLFVKNVTGLTAGTKEFYRVWADSFTIPGLAYIFIAAIIFLMNEGAFTPLGYMGRTIIRTLNPYSRKEKKNYYEYSQSRKKIKGYLCILWEGLAIFLVGLIFLILFYTA